MARKVDGTVVLHARQFDSWVETVPMSAKAWFLPCGLLILAGCTFPVKDKVDKVLCRRSSAGIDLVPSNNEFLEKLGKLEPEPKADDRPGKAQDLAGTNDLVLTAAQESRPPMDLFLKRLQIPADVPGSEAPPIFLPKGKQYKDIIQKFFPPMPRMERDPDFPPGPEGQPLTLADLQKIAYANSPLLRQVASDVEASRGASIQVGAYPNPMVGYQSTGVSASGGPTFGLFFSQTIKTMGKLKLAQAAALMDLQNAEIAYRKAETDLMTLVRTSYYAVLVAQESIRANRGLAELTEEVYKVMLDQLRGGEVATYEPLQLSVFATQARTALVTARNSRLLAWKQLASALGVPHMPPTALVGNIQSPVPCLSYDKALAHILTRHTDVLTTAGAIEKARFNLRLAQVTAYPDVNVQAGLLNDVSQPGPSRLTTTVQVSVPVPLFDQNQGGIRQNQGALLRAIEEPHRVQADLTARFSEAYRRYEENRVLLEMYRTNILPKQVQAFRAAVKRHYGGEVGGVAYNDLVASEQNLVAVIPLYLNILSAQWQAVVDVANFLQTDQLYRMVDEVEGAPAICLEELLRLPCHHPCSNLVPWHASEGLAPVSGVDRMDQPASRHESVRPQQEKHLNSPGDGTTGPTLFPALPSMETGSRTPSIAPKLLPVQNSGMVPALSPAPLPPLNSDASLLPVEDPGPRAAFQRTRVERLPYIPAPVRSTAIER